MIDQNERSAVISTNGVEYDLVLTTRATKEIASRDGGIENLGNKLMKSENFEDAIEAIVWLITLLANQGIMIQNLKNPKSKKALLTEETVELLTTPSELSEFKDAIMQAIVKGTKRNVESEDSVSKNVQAE